MPFGQPWVRSQPDHVYVLSYGAAQKATCLRGIRDKDGRQREILILYDRCSPNKKRRDRFFTVTPPLGNLENAPWEVGLPVPPVDPCWRTHGIKSYQYESAVTKSLLATVPSDHHVVMATELLMNWTWPSAKRTLAPPGCMLVTLAISA